MNKKEFNKINYPNIAYGQYIYKFDEHIPIIQLKEFKFYGIIRFDEKLYKKTISNIHKKI